MQPIRKRDQGAIFMPRPAAAYSHILRSTLHQFLVLAALSATVSASPLVQGESAGGGESAFGIGAPERFGGPAMLEEPEFPGVAAPEEWQGYRDLDPAVQRNLVGRNPLQSKNQPYGPTNVRVNDSTGDASNEIQSTVSVAAWGRYVVVCFYDSFGRATGDRVGYAWSCDYGRTFADGGALPKLGANDSVMYPAVLTDDDQGNFYVTTSYWTLNSSLFKTGDAVAVWKGSFSGSTFGWSPPVFAASTTNIPTQNKFYYYTPCIAADPYDSHVYIIYSDYTGSNDGYATEVHSADRGVTWSSPVRVSATGHWQDFSTLAIGPEHEVYVIFWSEQSKYIWCNLGNSYSPNSFMFRRSLDHGSSWSAENIIAYPSTNDFFTGPGDYGSPYVPTLLAVDRSNGPNRGRIYLAWSEIATWGAPSSTGTTVAEVESNATPATATPVTLGDDATGTAASTDDIDFWRINLTAGQTVLLQVEPQGWNCGSGGATHSFAIRLYATPANTTALPDTLLACSNRSTFPSRVVHTVQRTGTYYFRILLTTTGATNITYRIRTRLLALAAPSGAYPARDARDVVLISSGDRGATWSSKVRVNDSPAGLADERPSVAVSPYDGRVLVFWYDRRESLNPGATNQAQFTDYYFAESTNGGTSFGPGRRLTDVSGAGAGAPATTTTLGYFNLPDVVGGTFYAGWADLRSPNSATGTDAYAARIDLEPPSPAIVGAPSEGSWIDAYPPALRWTASDYAQDGPILYAHQLNGGGYTAWAADSLLDVTGGAEGDYLFQVKAKDVAGNESAPVSRLFHIDLTGPGVVISSGPSEGSFTGATSSVVGWTGSDIATPAGLLRYGYAIDGGAESAFAPDTSVTLDGYPEGPHSVRVRVRDAVGHIGTSPAVRNFIIDRTAPATAFVTAPADSSWVLVASVPLAWIGTDSQAPVNTLTYASRLDGGPYSAYTAAIADTLMDLADGFHRIRVRAKDPAGNVDATPDSLSFFIHARAPVVSFTAGPSAGAYLAADSVFFAWTAVDIITPRSGLLFSSVLDTAATAWAPDTSRVLRGLSEGAHTLTARARDGHDYVGTIARSFTVDLTPPETEITAGPADSSWVSASTVTINFRGSDHISLPGALLFSWRLDGGAWSDFGTTASVQLTGLASGLHTFEVRSRDQALLQDPSPARRVFRVGVIDLVVTAVAVPDSGRFDVPFSLSYTVANAGQGPASGLWYDRVYLSTDSLAGGDVQIAEFARPGTLYAGESYTQTPQVTVPWRVPDGKYWILVTTDARGQVNEENAETNNSRIARGLPLTTPPHPDLQVSNVTHPGESWAGQPCLITFRVRNLGTVTATGTWTERILISSDGAPGGDDAQLATFQYPYGLPPGGMYEHTHQVTIPSNRQGNQWIVVQTDYGNRIREYAEESNNNSVSVDPLYINAQQYPNLVVDTVEGPAEVQAGETMQVHWVVRNAGPVATDIPLWSDRVYLSPLPYIVPGATTILGTFPNPAYLPAGQSYSTTREVTMPGDIAGDFYLIVQTDVNLQENEGGQESDNQRASSAATRALHLAAFLRVPSVQPPAAAWSGQEISVRWVVKNEGDATFTSDHWDDGLVLSRDAAYDSQDTLLATGYFHATRLARGESDTLTETVRLPEDMSGMLHLFAVPNIHIVDSVHGLAASDSIEVNPSPPPDLHPTALSMPLDSIGTGSQVPITYTVLNKGPGIVGMSGWKDALYISSDSLLNRFQDPRLGLYAEDLFLVADSSYAREVSVSVPSNLWGSYYLILASDVESRVDEGEYEGNNTRVLGPVRVYLTPPDLQVTALAPAAPASSGRPVVLRWTVSNLGLGTTSPGEWSDGLYLSDDAVLNLPGDLSLGERRHHGALSQAGSYGDSLTWTVPDTLSGPHYLIARTDVHGELGEYNGEDNNTRDSTIVIQLSPPPDLQVTAVEPRTALWSGQSARIRWSVANFGSGDSYDTFWRDGLYLSSDSLLSPDDTLVTNRDHHGSLASGLAYTDSVTVTLPVNRSGPGWLIVKTDVSDQVYEVPFESNNVHSRAVDITLTPPPDLVVSAFGLTGEAWSGQSLPFAWTVVNAGTGVTPNSAWQDGIYFSADSTLELSQDALVATFDRSGSLGVGAQYGATGSYVLPQGASGTVYLFAVTDRNRVVYEHLGEGNNVRRLAVIVQLTPPPDLQVVSLASPGQITATASTQIQWSVANRGIGSTGAAGWQDRLYLSDDAVLSPSDNPPLLILEHSSALNPDDGYMETRSIIFPLEKIGTKYLICQTDALDAIYEHTNETNNQRVQQVTIVAPPPTPPDLAVTSLTAGALYKSDEKAYADVQWTVRNVGGYPPSPSQSYWSDGIFLSADSLYDANDTFLGAFSHTGGLPSSAEYTQSAQVHFPNGSSGAGVVLCITDYLDRVTEVSPDNNLRAVGVMIALNPVDLQVDSVATPLGGISGQYLPIRWSVGNHGVGITESPSWYDAIYLSRDTMVDETDALLGSKRHDGALAPAGSYTDSLQVQIPLGYSGSYFVLVRTDKNNEVYEHEQESNNVGRTYERITVSLPAPADLVVPTVTVPSSGTGGEPIEIAWSVANIGANPAPDRWYDAVYISADSTWDLSDLLLGEVEHTGGLAPGKVYRGNYAGVLQADFPGIAPGQYHAIVRTDIRNNVNESHEDNNSKFSPEVMAADVTEVPPGLIWSDSLGMAESRFFHLVAGPQADLRVHLAASGPYDDLELYVGYGYVPDRIHYASRHEANPDTSVIIPGGNGLCYAMLYGRYLPGPATYTLSTEELPFGIASVMPLAAGNAGFATLSLSGGQLDTAVRVRLVGFGGSSREAWRLNHLNSAQLEAQFDLQGVSPGLYDLELITAFPDTARLPDAFSITEGRGSFLVLTVDGAGSLRPGTESDYVITVRNDGDADAYDVLTPFVLAPGTHYQLVNGDSTLVPRLAAGERTLLSASEVRIRQTAQYAVRVWSDQDISLDIAVIEGPVLKVEPSKASTVIGSSQTDGGRSEAAVVGAYLEDVCIAFRDDLASHGYSGNQGGLLSAFAGNLRLEMADRSAVFSEIAIRAALVESVPLLWDPQPPPAIVDGAVQAALDQLRAYVESVMSSASNARVYVRVVRATDPNEKLGPNGRDDAFISNLQSVPFAIYFENVSGASAPARQVRLVDNLSSDWDWQKLRLTEFAFGDVVIPVPPGYSYYHTTYTLPSGLLLEIDAGIDVADGRTHWYFTTIDPATGQPTDDPLDGFLPPNDESGRGQGHVGFTIQADPGLSAGAEILNSSVIVFDENNPITTNAVRCVIRDAYADLAPTAMRVQTTEIPPIEGDLISLTLTVQNLGEVRADSVAVDFYAGHPDSGGVAFTPTTWIPVLAAGAHGDVSVDWTPVRLLGPQKIYAVIDRIHRVLEADEGNNVWVTTLELAPRSIALELATDLNLVGLPLDPGEAYDASAFAATIGASVLMQADSTGNFRSFVPADPLSPAFPVEAGKGYLAVVPQGQTVMLSGVTGIGRISVHQGLNMVSLPIENDSLLTARAFALSLNGSAVIRYDTSQGRFRTFLPDIHAGSGFAISGREGYIVLVERDTTVVFDGGARRAGLAAPMAGGIADLAVPLPDELASLTAPLVSGLSEIGDSTAIVVRGAASSGSSVEGTAVLGITGVLQQIVPRGVAGLETDLCLEISNARNGVKTAAVAVAGSGHFDAALVDFSGGLVVAVGDRLRIGVAGAAGSTSGDPFEYQITAEDVARRYARIDGALLAQLPQRTLMEAALPNPMRGEVGFRYQLAAATKVDLQIFSVDGRRLADLVDRHQKPGYYSLQWSGTDDGGRPLPGGVYFLRFEAGNYRNHQKIVVVR
jgi:subtilase family serine protease